MNSGGDYDRRLQDLRERVEILSDIVQAIKAMMETAVMSIDKLNELIDVVELKRDLRGRIVQVEIENERLRCMLGDVTVKE
jgi:hypothetical protein